jgi:hypothetical protein
VTTLPATPVLGLRREAAEFEIGRAPTQLKVFAHVDKAIHHRFGLGAAAARAAWSRAVVLVAVIFQVSGSGHRQRL